MLKKSLTILGALLSCATVTHANLVLSPDVILAIDFNMINGAFTSPTYSAGGFTGWNLAAADTQGPTDYTVGTFGDYTVSFRSASNQGGIRDRLGSGSPATGGVSDLYRDFARVAAHKTDSDTTLPTGGASAAVVIAGLDPNSTYNIQLWGYDHTFNNGWTFRYFDMNTGGGTLLGMHTNSTNSIPADLTGFTITGTVATDVQGRIVLGTSADMGFEVSLNAFAISPVPEPSVYAAIAGLLVACLAIIRRRKA